MSRLNYLIKLSLRYMQNRSFATIVSIFAIAVSIMFLTLIGAANFSLKKSAAETSIKYPLVIGPSNVSSTQLVMLTLFHLDKPDGVIPYTLFEEIKKDERVSAAYPIAIADSIQSYPIVGTNEEYLKQFSTGVAAGKIDLSKPENAVLGFEVAEKIGLKIGDTFKGSHGAIGTEDAHTHDEILYQVVGILNKTNSPEDSAVYIDFKTVWLVHKNHNHEHIEHEKEEAHAENEKEHEHHEHQEHGEECEHHKAAEKESDSLHKKEAHLVEGNITAVIVKTKNPVFTAQIEREFSMKYKVTAADTGKTVRRLINYMNKAEKAVTIFNTITILLISLMILVTMMMSLNERKKELALMRSLGIKRHIIALLVMIESLIITLAGVLGGIFSGHALIWWAKNLLDQKLGTAIEPLIFTNLELNGILITVFAGELIAIVGMIRIYRMNLTEELSK